MSHHELMGRSRDGESIMVTLHGSKKERDGLMEDFQDYSPVHPVRTHQEDKNRDVIRIKICDFKRFYNLCREHKIAYTL